MLSSSQSKNLHTHRVLSSIVQNYIVSQGRNQRQICSQWNLGGFFNAYTGGLVSQIVFYNTMPYLGVKVLSISLFYSTRNFRIYP